MADVGRPRIYSDPTLLAADCEAYFVECWDKGRKPTITGLTYFLGFADKTTLYDYRDRPEFSHSIKRALLRVEMSYEESLQGTQVTGPIFALKNMGWKDKTETALTDGNGDKLSLNIIMPSPKMETKDAGSQH